MRLLGLLIISVAILATVACSGGRVKAPVAQIRAQVLEKHGHQRIDDYYWLRERDNPEVITYLEAENDYTEAVLADVGDLRERLYDEIVARIKPDEETVPHLDNGYWYRSRYRKGQEYPVYLRRPESHDDESVLLDVNLLAEGHDYCSVRHLEVSPDNTRLAFAIDTVGRRKYDIRFRDLAGGGDLTDVIPEVTGESIFANDNETLFYTRQDPDTLRSFQVWRHRLGTRADDDVLVYEEGDETFNVAIEASMSRRYIFINSHQTLSTEYRIIDADHPENPPRILTDRERGLEYSVDHLGDRFVILTNHEAHDFRLMTAAEDCRGVTDWRELVPHRPGIFVQDFDLFDGHYVVTEREDGQRRLAVHRWDGGESHTIEFDEEAYSVWTVNNLEPTSRTLRFVYSSLTTPETTFDYDMETRDRSLLKRRVVLGGFNSANYEIRRLHAPARDGSRVPISLVCRKGVELDGSNPLLLYAYGSYGYSLEPDFERNRLSLVDRGFVYAIAHIRGGQELGRSWYEDGKLLNKKNTFTDFIDCAHHLVAEGWTSPERLAAEGGSAGGLLMGAVANMAPDSFRAIIAQVAYVDVITTMLDETIPLTTSEYDEWGNPNDREYYDYMLSYSPYDQVSAQDYPDMLITAGLHDSQVQYWEPAKWAAKLRKVATGESMLLLRTDMAAGHSGKTGRYQEHEETALEYAFLLKSFGLTGN